MSAPASTPTGTSLKRERDSGETSSSSNAESSKKVRRTPTQSPQPEDEGPMFEGEDLPPTLGFMPIEDQITFSGLLGTRPPPATTPLSRYRLLGRSGLRVSPFCLGTINFGQNWSAMTGQISKQEAERIFEAYVARGGNFIDIAMKYQDGESLEWVGEWVAKAGNREQLVIAAKYSLPLKHGDVNSGGNHRKSLFRTVEETLRHLRTSYLDVVNVHVWDFATPVDELMRALDDLVRLGKVHYVGISDTPAWQVSRANAIASLRGWTPFVSYQGKYNPAERGVETEILPMCREMGLGFVPWGLLEWTSRYGRETRVPEKHEGDGPHSQKIDEAVVAIAKEVGRSPAQVVINWAMQRHGVASAVLNCRDLVDFEEAIGGFSFKLTPSQVSAIDQATRFIPGFPFNYIGTTYSSSPWFKAAGTVVDANDNPL